MNVIPIDAYGRRLRVGQSIRVWWNTSEPNNQAKILAILPYTGCYPKIFSCVLQLPAPGTRKGWIEMAWQQGDRR